MRNFLHDLILNIVKAIVKVILPYKVIGLENLPKEGGVIICLNHISMFDPVFVVISCPREVHFLSKAELFSNKPLAWLLRLFGAFPVKRGEGDMDAINTAEEYIKAGEVVGIFVEGTRTKSPLGEPGRPKSGAALIAAESSGTIVPATVIYKKGRMKLFNRVTVRIGEPFTIDTGDDESLRRKIKSATTTIFDKIVELWKQGM